MAALTPMDTVSSSLISPTMITSGSCLRMERRAVAKVRPDLGLTCTWVIPSSTFSTGSSTVTTLIFFLMMRLSTAYRVVVLPLPVGPVTSTIPWGTLRIRSNISRCASVIPRRLTSISELSLSLPNSLKTTFSPKTEGRVEILRSVDTSARS